MKTIKVVAAVIRDGDKIFATQRGYGDLKGGWEFPGGKIEEGETPQEALKREIMEELDTEIEVGELIDTIEYDYPDFHLSMGCYWCSVVSGDLVLKEHEAARWLGKDAGWDIDYGWLDEVVIIPDPDWDAGNDQWLEDTRPGEVVDPDPEPDQGQPEEDLVDNGQENNPDENILPLTELEKQMVNRVLLELEKLKNVNVQNYQIQKITFCHVPAKTMNGILLLCEMFFQSAQLQDIDRMAIIWHEIHHIDKKHYSTSLESHQVIGDPIILNVPPEIEQIIRDRMAQEFEGTNMTPATIEAWYQQSITVTHFNSPEYYENEIETHRNERENFPNVSEFYENERTYLEWYYEEMLRIANEQLKK